MARKPPVSYAAMELASPPEPEAPQQLDPINQPSAQPAPAPVPPKTESRTLKEASAHIMTYVHPDAAKALKRYAVENNCKVHDICLEALESWFRAHGLRERVRAEPRKTV